MLKSIDHHRAFLVGMVVLILVVAAAGFAVAVAQGDEAPVVTVDSTVQEQVAALDFQISEAMTTLSQRLGDEPATEALLSRISLLQQKVSTLCGQLAASEVAATPGCL